MVPARGCNVLKVWQMNINFGVVLPLSWRFCYTFLNGEYTIQIELKFRRKRQVNTWSNIFTVRNLVGIWVYLVIYLFIYLFICSFTFQMHENILERSTFWKTFYPRISDYCPRRNFGQKAKSRRGTLVTCVYFKESTYSWNIRSVCQRKSWFAWTEAARNRQVMMTFLLFVPACTK